MGNPFYLQEVPVDASLYVPQPTTPQWPWARISPRKYSTIEDVTPFP